VLADLPRSTRVTYVGALERDLQQISFILHNSDTGWRRGMVVSGIRRMNEVNARRARLVPWMGDRLRAGIPYRYVTSQLVQLSLASLRGRLIEYQLRLG